VRRALLLLLLVPLTGCADSGAGAPCRLDSDCDKGFLCALDGRCRTQGEVEDSFVSRADVEVVTVPDADDGDVASDADVAGCTPVSGVFEATTPPCPTAPLVKPVKNLQLATEGHGLAQLAAVANQVLSQSFEKGESKLELRVDGSLAAGCERRLAWVRDERDIAADCTPVHSATMPFEVPNLVFGVIEAVDFDPESNVVHGRVDKEALMESLAPELRPVADTLIQEDIDLDGDSVPDRASVIINLTF